MSYSEVGGEVGGVGSLELGVGALGASTSPSPIGSAEFMKLPDTGITTAEPTHSLTFPTSSTFTFHNTTSIASVSTSPSPSYCTASGTSPPILLPPVTRPSLANMWGIGGFRTPMPPGPQPVMPPNTVTVTSTMGNPQMPSASYFTAPSMGYNFRMSGTNFIYKRKQDEDIDEDTPAPKQQITEEKMAAHMNALHISEQFKNHCLDKRSGQSSKTFVWDMEDEEDSDSDNADQRLKSTGRIVIAKEVQQIIPGENKLPHSLLRKYTEPSMEMVLWKPPGDIIRSLITTKVNQQLAEADQDAASLSPPSKSSKSTKTPSTESETTSQSSTVSSQVNGMCAEPSLSGTTTSSASSSPDSGVSLSSPPPSLSFLAATSSRPPPSSSYYNDNSGSSSSSSQSSELGPFPSTSSGIVSSGLNYFPPIGRPPSPLPEAHPPEEDYSDRMEFNNNNGGAPNYMWMEENNNSAFMDLNAVAAAPGPLAEPLLRPPNPEDLPPLPDDSDDMDL